jgi:DNA polymerase III epsilon subunit-like protein
MSYYLISIDCETTGLSVYTDQIVEFAAVVGRWNIGTDTVPTLATFSRRVKPTTRQMCKRAEEITGITNAMLVDQPPLSVVLAEFQQYVDDVCVEEHTPRVLLSYNGVAYDLPLMVSEIERYGHSALTYFRQLKLQCSLDLLPIGRTCLDVTLLRRKANGRCSYTLSDVYAAVTHRPLEGAHGALVDSVAVLELLTSRALRETCQLLLTAETECPLYQNPMSLVRTCLHRNLARTTTGTRAKATSKRILDAFVCTQKRQRNS